MDGFSAIPVFVTVVEKSGFSPAAKHLGISTSAVSKRINQLEEKLGVQLLHRTTRKLSLTEAGKHYYEHAARAYAAAKDAADAVAQLQGEPRGRLRINTPMSFGRLHIAPLIPEFLRQYPEITLDMVMEDRQVDLVKEGFDIAIRGGNLADSSLIARRIAPLHNVLCAAPSYIRDHRQPEQVSDLSQHNCLTFSYASQVNEWHFSKNGYEQTISVTGNYQVNNSEALLEAIGQGLGIGRLPTFIAAREIKEGRLVPLLTDYKMPSQTIYAVMIERQYMPAKVRVFIDFLIEKMGSAAPYWDQ